MYGTVFRLLPFSAHDEIACEQQHIHSVSCQVLRGKISSVGFCRMLAKSQRFLRDFLLHPEPLDFKMLQSSATLARCDPDASIRVRQDNCFHRHPESFLKGLPVQVVR